MTDTLTYTFEEIHLAGEGLLANGTAELVSAGEGYEGEFFVRSITFHKGPTLDPQHYLKNSHMAWLFNAIASEIENSTAAAAAWKEFEKGATQADLDNEHNDRRAQQPRPQVYNSLGEHSTWNHAQAGLRQVNGARI